MANFIKLTSRMGNPFFINMDHISSIKVDEDGETVMEYGSEKELYVCKEKPEEVMALLNGGACK